MDEDAAAGVADLASALSRSLRRSVACRIEGLGLTPARLRALRQVAAAAPVRMGELAEDLGIVPRSVTSLVDDLAEAGLVERIDDPADRRATLIALTDAGREALAATDEMRSQAATQLLGHLSAEELATLTALLRRALAG